MATMIMLKQFFSYETPLISINMLQKLNLKNKPKLNEISAPFGYNSMEMEKS